MWRFLAGAGSALLLCLAGILFWQGRGGDPVIGAPPAAQATRLAAVDVAPPLEASERTREEKRFARYDKDKNGAVGRDEYLASRRKAYAKLDTNGDGRLSFEEYAVKTTGKFAGADRDRSGALTPAEFAATRVIRKTKPKPNCPPSLRTPDEDEG